MRPPPPVEVEVRPGVTVKYLAWRSPRRRRATRSSCSPAATACLNLQPNGSIGTNLSGNFLVRSRDRFVQRDLFVAVVDTPNQVAIDGNVRLSAQYAQDMAHVIADVRTRIARRKGLAGRHQFGHDVGGEHRRPPAARSRRRPRTICAARTASC